MAGGQGCCTSPGEWIALHYIPSAALLYDMMVSDMCSFFSTFILSAKEVSALLVDMYQRCGRMDFSLVENMIAKEPQVVVVFLCPTPLSFFASTPTPLLQHHLWSSTSLQVAAALTQSVKPQHTDPYDEDEDEDDGKNDNSYVVDNDGWQTISRRKKTGKRRWRQHQGSLCLQSVRMHVLNITTIYITVIMQ